MARILAALFLLILAIVVFFTVPIDEPTDELNAQRACCPSINLE